MTKSTINKRIIALHAHVKKDAYFVVLRGIMRTYRDAGVYLVGGVVRDALLDRPCKDYDVVVTGVPKTALERLLRTYGVVNLVGKKFGVYKLVPRNVRGAKINDVLEPLDIALPRTEQSVSMQGVYRDFAIKSDHRLSIADDLSRRDFTINAMALDMRTGALIDPYGGADDLRHGVIRTVGVPAERFAEDYSRILRAIRFAVMLGFSFDEATDKELRAKMARLNDHVKTPEGLVRVVPYEVIGREVIKALYVDPLRAIALFDAMGVFGVLMPEVLAMQGCDQPPLWHSEGDVWTHALLAVKILMSRDFAREFDGEAPDALLVLTVFLHDLGKPYTKKTPERDGVDRVRFDGHDLDGAVRARVIAERLKLSGVEGYAVNPDHIYWLIRHHLVLLNGAVEEMKYRTIEKYFFEDPYLGRQLQKLIYCDSSATVREDGVSSMGSYRALKKRVAAMVGRGVRPVLPAPLLTGDEVMACVGISAGPRVGALLALLREAQLAGTVRSKKEAREYLLATCV